MAKLILKRKSGTPAISQRKQKPVARESFTKPPSEDNNAQCAYALEVFIKACGGVSKCAKFLAVQRQHIHEWRKRGAVGRTSAFIIDQVPACRAKGFVKEYFRPDISQAQWDLMDNYQFALIAGAKEKLEEVKQSDIPLLDLPSAEKQLALDPPKSAVVTANLRGSKPNLK